MGSSIRNFFKESIILSIYISPKITENAAATINQSPAIIDQINQAVIPNKEIKVAGIEYVDFKARSLLLFLSLYTAGQIADIVAIRAKHSIRVCNMG